MDYGAAIRDRLPAAWRGDEFEPLLTELETYLPEDDVSGILAAHEFSAKAHEGQERISGDPYITHPSLAEEDSQGGFVMARITVEDCSEKIPNMFQLVLVASKRARQLANGAEPMVDWENDKPTVVALREVAEGYITESILTERDQPMDDLLDLDSKPSVIPEDLLAIRPISIGD